MKNATAPPPQEGVTFELLTNAARLEQLRPAWDALWRAAGAEYFLGFASTWHSWHAIHAPQGAQLRCAVAWQDGTLRALLPMVVHRHSRWHSASTCGPRSAECPDILIVPHAGSHALAAGLLRSFLRQAQADYLEFEFVKLGSHLERAIAATPGLQCVRSWDEPVGYASFGAESDWPSLAASLNRTYQTNTARCLRRLNEQGTLRFDIAQGRATVLIDWVLEQKRRWSERTGKFGDWVTSAHYRDYLNALFASDPRFLVFALRLDDKPIAVKLVAVNETSASGMLTGYDEDYRRFSPGNVLDEHMMQHLFETYRAPDGRHLDFHLGPGVENFKTHWSRGNFLPSRSYRIAASAWGRARLRVKSTLAELRRIPSTDVWDLRPRQEERAASADGPAAE